jgi:predicted ATP-dependent protease
MLYYPVWRTLPSGRTSRSLVRVNQWGEIQAIGGVNEKIEGFYDVCRAVGLTGKQVVLTPESNVRHLVLREDVIQAVADGKFHI